jgi:hypothetical protein
MLAAKDADHAYPLHSEEGFVLLRSCGKDFQQRIIR